VDNQPPAVNRRINESIAGFHLLAGPWLVTIHHERIKPYVTGDVASGMNDPGLDRRLRRLLQKMGEIPADRFRTGQRAVLHGRQQRCVGCVFRDHGFRPFRRKGAVPLVEQGADLRLGNGPARFRRNRLSRTHGPWRCETTQNRQSQEHKSRPSSHLRYPPLGIRSALRTMIARLPLAIKRGQPIKRRQPIKRGERQGPQRVFRQAMQAQACPNGPGMGRLHGSDPTGNVRRAQ
jgi:hypothetical protein